jgi:cyanophycin synthetase
MVEKFLPGHDWRLLVIGDKLIAAARRDPPLVIGDGTHTVRELVDIVNSDPRRSDGHATSLTKIRFDEIALARLAEQGYSADSCRPRRARRPAQQRQPVHRRHRHRCHRRRASRTRRRRRCCSPDRRPRHRGIDVVCDTMHKPLEEQGGIVECNAAPACACTSTPRSARAAPSAKAIVGMMFPDGDNAASGRRHRRHQRQDHHQPPDRPHLRIERPARRHDQHRRRLR